MINPYTIMSSIRWNQNNSLYWYIFFKKVRQPNEQLKFFNLLAATNYTLLYTYGGKISKKNSANFIYESAYL